MSKLIDAVTNDMTKLIPMLITAGKCPGDYVNEMPTVVTNDYECCMIGVEHCTICWGKHLEVQLENF